VEICDPANAERCEIGCNVNRSRLKSITHDKSDLMENFCEGLVIQDDDYSRLLRGTVQLTKSRVHNYIKAPTQKANCSQSC